MKPELRAAAEAGAGLAERVIVWQRQAGRRGLPWQGVRDPYRVWLSEIMLQQTQVSTVLDYYPRFMARFPDVQSLARAPLEDVLGLWSGLGYYSRARNLHRCARAVVLEHGGRFPPTAQALATLPGIGRSTAAAIAAFSYGEPAAILDGNVKRVLTRFWGVADDLSVAANERALWSRAEAALPVHDLANSMPAYTQGLMDLGATVCTRSRPSCGVCPLAHACVARAQGAPQRYPVKTRKLRRGHQTLWLLHLHDRHGRVWLVQRPHQGIWAALHCLPVFDELQALLAVLPATAQIEQHAPVRHVLTHRDLDLHFVSVEVDADIGLGLAAHASGAWRTAGDWPSLGLPAPIRKFLSEPLARQARLFKDRPAPGDDAD